MTLREAVSALGKSGWLAAIVTVLAISLSECHRMIDSRLMQQESQDTLMRRMDLRFDWLKLHAAITRTWMEQASPKLKVQPPMEMPNEWPMDFTKPQPPPDAGIYAEPLEIP